MTIAEICKRVRYAYGAELKNIDPLAACWVAEEIFAECAANVFSKISKYRNGFGLDTCFPSYGTPLFNELRKKPSATDES